MTRSGLFTQIASVSIMLMMNISMLTFSVSHTAHEDGLHLQTTSSSVYISDLSDLYYP